jgi:hypothetical protein
VNSWQNMTLGDIGKAVARYRPFLAVLAGVLLLVVVLPGRAPEDDSQLFANGGESTQTTTADGPAADATAGGAETVTTDASGAVTSGGATATTAAPKPGTKVTTGTGATAVSGAAEEGTGNITAPAGVGADCDTTTGRIKVPTKFAPPCMPAFDGKNGGKTWNGVNEKEILVVAYRAKSNPALDAALAGANASDDPALADATFDAYIDYINKHYQLYGRQIKVKHFNGNADADEADKGAADAIAIADMGAFVSIGAANNAMIDELKARKVMCICSVSQPQEFYEERAPYAGYTTLMSSTQGYIHRAEYVGKRLAGRKAKFAGLRDAIPMSTENRAFGFLWYETSDGAYKSGADFFATELKNKYGVALKESISYNGFPDVDKTQTQARPIITKLKESGVNSVIFSGDPIAPGIFTAEAQRQTWQPEWIITGSALVDTTLFARTYDKDQWSRAFGISFLTIRTPPEIGDAYYLHKWHTGQAPAAKNTYGVIYASPFILGTGIHMAGPNLNPQTFQQGLFNYPLTGKGNVTTQVISYGKHGIWPFTDYTLYDDVTEIFWDNTVRGKDEVGNDGVGAYRYVNNGARYLPGEHPKDDPRVLGDADPNSSPAMITERPANEKPPDYPHTPH